MTSDPPRQAPPLRRTVLFSGRVHGVGFRFTTESIAAGFAVTGFVRNLPDGRVELVAEGQKSDLDRFQQGIERTMARNITKVAASDSAPTGEFTSFGIAY